MSTLAVVAPHETAEFRPLTVNDANNTAVTTYKWQITASGARPVGTWLSPISYSGRTGFTVTGLAMGTYSLWIQITDGPYLPVLEPITLYLD